MAGVTLFDGADAGLDPATFVAITVNVYAVPFVSPVTTCVVDVVPALLSTPPAGLDVTVYPVIALPPLLTGAVKLTLACRLPGVAVTAVGAPGTVRGVTLFDELDGALEPAAFVATTVKVYAVPLVSPVIVWLNEVVPALLSTPPAGFETTV